MTPVDLMPEYEEALATQDWAQVEPLLLDCHAACVYEYRWSGLVGGKEARGAGRGTSLLVNEDGRWLVLAEHLGPLA